MNNNNNNNKSLWAVHFFFGETKVLKAVTVQCDISFWFWSVTAFWHHFWDDPMQQLSQLKNNVKWLHRKIFWRNKEMPDEPDAGLGVLTSRQIGVGQVGFQEHGLSRLQAHHIEEIDTESSSVTRKFPVQLQDDLPFNRLQIISPFLWWREKKKKKEENNGTESDDKWLIERLNCCFVNFVKCMETNNN